MLYTPYAAASYMAEYSKPVLRSPAMKRHIVKADDCAGDRVGRFGSAAQLSQQKHWLSAVRPSGLCLVQ